MDVTEDDFPICRCGVAHDPAQPRRDECLGSTGPVDPDHWAKRARQHREAQAVRLGFAMIARGVWRETRGTARGSIYRAAMAAELEFAAALGRAKRSARRLQGMAVKQ